MNPAAGSRTAGSPDDAATVALQGASLAFQKRPPAPQPASSQHSSLSAGLRSSSKHTNTTPDSSRSRSPPLQNQQHSLEHYRENGALLAATSSVERAKSPGAAAGQQRFPHLRPHPDQHVVAADASPPGLESDDTPLAAGLVAARGTDDDYRESHTRGCRESSVHFALGAKSPSLIAATLAASRGGSPTPTTLRKPRQMQSVNALQEVDTVDSQPISTTDSLISLFEADNSGGKHASTSRQKPSSLSPARKSTKPPSSPVQPVVRKSARPTSLPIKQTTAAAIPTTSKPTSKQRSARAQSSDGPPTPPQPGRKSAAAAPRRPPTPPVVTDTTTVSASTTPASTSKRIVQVAASKPRVTPPKARETLEVDGASSATTPPKVISRSKSTTAMNKLDAIGEVATPRKHSRRPPPLALSKELKDEGTPGPPPPDNGTSATPRQQSPTPHVISRSTPEVLSPKPTRITRSASLRSGTLPPAIVLGPASDVQSPPSADPKKRKVAEKRPPTPPKPRNSHRLAPVRPTSGRPRGNSDTPLSKATSPNSMWGLPIVSSNTSTIPKASKPQPSPPNRRESMVSAPPSPTHEPPGRQPLQSSSKPMPLNSMTNAIMASSLASSRLTPHNTGSSLPPPPLPKRQKSPHLLHTLRQPHSEPEEGHDRQRKSHRHRLHGNKHTHHEGSRRRWRDQVSEKERKRYEALWASNRGLLLTHESPSASVGSGLGTELSECVANVVVRDIWKRSRLPTEELAEVWELVDRGHRGYLTRQEFVVGMFLIDQRLRGRKLPPKVSDSIWGSVNGVTVWKPRPKH
ncbi:Increased rDNA silencing protein 4 [Beauveria bassiana D1-5]|uniref:Increased rDNA silencing protein 4 n=1 Tax=Beauveria bassiana D1-5 TaxID=1245745 RepID=A0A0A2V5L0_BEABA|nr:Increased rDNA silencing protein 4 [Beauveria bassiana D1-5]